MRSTRTLYVQYGVGDGVFYESTINGDKHKYDVTIRYSELDSSWTKRVRGKRAAKLTDNGDGITIRMQGKRIRLDYSQMELLELLIMHANAAEGKEMNLRVFKDQEDEDVE